MPFWVYGRDGETGAPDQFLSEAASEEAARAEAAAQGMLVERVEPEGDSTEAQAATEFQPRRCTGCGRPMPEWAEHCSECGALLPDVDQVDDPFPTPAGFWIRVGALLGDGLFFDLPLGLLGMFALSAKSLPLLIVVYIAWFIYKPFMESYYGATLGKMAFGLKVVDEKGDYLTLRTAYIRFLPFLLSGVTSVLGTFWLFGTPEFNNVSGLREISSLMDANPFRPLDILMTIVVLGDCLAVAFTYRCRAVHDMMAGSFCIRHTSILRDRIR